MTDTLRDKLIQKGWAYACDADTLVRLIEEHYADEPAVPDGGEPAAVTGHPSDEEIMGLMPQQMHEDLAAAVRAMAAQEGIDSATAKGAIRIMLNRHVVDLARAVLARWGNLKASLTSSPPADGEVAELPQQQVLVPVPVSERLPGPGDCDAEHYCWRWNAIGGLWARQPLARRWYEFESHWLPAHALPLPEVNNG